MRKYSITKKKGQWYNTKVTDSYGKEYQNYFETEEQAHEWVNYVWEKEDWFNSVDSQKLLNEAIANCIEIDEKNGIEPSLD